MDDSPKLLHLETAAFMLQIQCPNNHGLLKAMPSGFRGIRLDCGCEFLADERNLGWYQKSTRAYVVGIPIQQ